MRSAAYRSDSMKVGIRLARKRKRNLKWQCIYPKHSEDASVTWLAELFQELNPLHPNLTIERFARDHGVEPHSISRFIDTERSSNKVALWHGTTADRSRLILEDGFRARGRIWFTGQSGFARSHAIQRSKHRSEPAVVFRCNIDLAKYSDFDRYGPHYAFRHTRISRDVIRTAFRLGPTWEDEGELVNVTITKDSGKPEVMRWINNCLKLIAEKELSENHPAVEALFTWVNVQYSAGREEPISDEEMLIQMSKVSMKLAARHFGIGPQVIDRWISNGRLKAKSLRGYWILPFRSQRVNIKKSRNVVNLWHGTTRSRAESIIRQGFRADKAMEQRRGKGQTFFAASSKMARRYARTKAKTEGDRPAVITCSIDLNHYTSYERQGDEIYAFNHECIASEVIKEVDGLPKRRQEKLGNHEQHGAEITNVALTFNAGRAGIAYWVNSWLGLSDPHRIREDHEAVTKIKQWLDEQIDAGRFGEVPDDELMEQLSEHLPQMRRHDLTETEQTP